MKIKNYTGFVASNWTSSSNCTILSVLAITSFVGNYLEAQVFANICLCISWHGKVKMPLIFLNALFASVKYIITFILKP